MKSLRDAGLVAAAPAVAHGQTVRGAARAAERCLDRHGWDARLADGGRTTNAKAPRKLKTYPYRPWYSVAFYRDGKVIRWNADRLKPPPGGDFLGPVPLRRAATLSALRALERLSDN